MTIYIAYKYSNNKDKEHLIKNLENIASQIDGFGHKAFLLGRDVKKWEYMHISLFKLMPIIYGNIKKSDLILAYIDCNSFSKGLLSELIIGKLLGKKIVCYCSENCNLTFYKPFFNKIIKIDDPSRIKNEDFSFA